MRRTGMALMAVALLLSACGMESGEGTAAMEALSGPVTEPKAGAEEAATPATTESRRAVTAPGARAVELPADTGVNASAVPMGKEEVLALAQANGCLDCHRVDAQLIGPSWQAVSARYRDDPAAQVFLVEKVKRGGKGNWNEVTGGIPMPPYSPRVSDEDIEKLVSFVLSL